MTKLNCPSKPLNPPYPLKLGQNLVQPSPCLSRLLPLSSPSAGKSSPSTKISSQRCLSPTSPLSTYGSSSLTKPSKTISQPNNISTSPILLNLMPFSQLSSPLMELVPIPLNPLLNLGDRANHISLISAANPAISGNAATALSLNTSASIHIAATGRDVEGLVDRVNVPKQAPKLDNKRIAQGQCF